VLDKDHSVVAADASFDFRGYERTWSLELIAREADKHTRRGFELANKRALFSARLELTRALRITAQGLDTERQTNRYSRALAAGLRALAEAEDFVARNGRLEAELDLPVIIGAHRTPLFRGRDATELTPLAAMREYHTYAQEQLASAVGREVAGSMALCGLAKLYVVIGDLPQDEGIPSAHPKAMALFQAALIVAPENGMAANELGVLLARNGRHGDARVAFEHSVAEHATAAGWRNLALTYERLGLTDAAHQAARQSLALRGQSDDAAQSVAVTSRGAVRWVPPAALANSGMDERAEPGQVPTAQVPKMGPHWNPY
jgi:tetratricopeptide (TPR) repeat protein